ncbi:hypothetical protein [Pontibacter liquoris]|uniref:hypothetical protein n=1 Tax=Pontibacter liquoris TaxID=2905677 RepID=UPI001FA6C3AE|nr:hypothetical protein [Pontibacter liquoris]
MPLNHTSKFSELTDAQFCLIGKIVVEFSNIEYLLGEILGRLLLTPPFLSLTFTESFTANKLQDAISNALDLHARRYKYKLISKEVVDRIKSINSRVKGARGKRNQFAHFCWMRSTDDELFGVKFSGRIPITDQKNKDSLKVTIRQLDFLYKECYSIVEELSKIAGELPISEESSLFKDI